MTTKELQSLYKRSGHAIPHEFAKPDAAKYNATKKELDGHVFDSSVEASAYSILKLWEKAGVIHSLELQPLFVLQVGFRDSTGKWRRPIKYIADFRFKNTESDRMIPGEIIVDVKGFPTPAFRIKEKMFRALMPDVELQIWNKNKVRELSRI